MEEETLEYKYDSAHSAAGGGEALTFDEDATQVYEFGKFGDYHEYVFAAQPKKDLHIHGGRWPIEVLPDGTWGKVKVPKVPKVKKVKEVPAPKSKKVAALRWAIGVLTHGAVPKVKQSRQVAAPKVKKEPAPRAKKIAAPKDKKVPTKRKKEVVE